MSLFVQLRIADIRHPLNFNISKFIKIVVGIIAAHSTSTFAANIEVTVNITCTITITDEIASLRIIISSGRFMGQ